MNAFLKGSFFKGLILFSVDAFLKGSFGEAFLKDSEGRRKPWFPTMGGGNSKIHIDPNDLGLFRDYFLDKTKSFGKEIEDGIIKLRHNKGLHGPENLGYNDMFIWLLNMSEHDSKIINSLSYTNDIYMALASGVLKYIKIGESHNIIMQVAKIITYNRNTPDIIPPKTTTVGAGERLNIIGGMIGNLTLLDVILIVLLIVVTYFMLQNIGVDFSADGPAGQAAKKENLIPYRPLIAN